MAEEKILPTACNNFGLSTNNGQTFILEFSFQEPPMGTEELPSNKTFSRIAIDRIGLERFVTLLQTALKTKMGGDGKPPTPPQPPKDRF